MTFLCLFPLFYCHVSLLNMTYYFPLLIDPFPGHSSPLLLLIHGTNVATLPLKLHDIQVLFAPLLVTSVKLRQTSTVRCAPQGPFGRNIPVLMILPGPLSSRITLLLPHRFLLVPLLHMMISITPSSPLLILLRGLMAAPTLPGEFVPSISTTSLAHHFQNILHRKVSPPTQALVFIPKADQGEYADNYRPLGLPNTCDRIVDRAAYTLFCQTLIGKLHPAQALLNLFREPQGNYLAVQQFLDTQETTHCVLLSDLAKAFERVNPHWIIHVLAARGVAFWIICYCRHILFGRKVLHKIGSTFRPSLPINIGVDMGRAFSVLLFCIAMDPWYYHVNRIP